MESRNTHFISLFEFCMLCIVMVSVSGVGLLMVNWFSSIRSLIAGAVLALMTILALKVKVSFRIKGIDPILLIILLAALFFRAEPYLWIMGGQDQGLYVSMSAHYERTGSTFVKDSIREIVDQADKPEYDQTQVLFKKITADSREIQGKYPFKIMPAYDNRIIYAMTQPGIYLKNLTNSEYVFQFYPLHPIWMAIFAKLFGSDNRVYSIVFFSLLSIVTFYKLAMEISGGDRFAAWLVSAFLALNPLHAYFAKFPVSETVGLFFSSCGFLFLIKYCRKLAVGLSPLFPIILSLGMYFCLFMTHISGFLYSVYFSGLLVYVLLTESNGFMKRHLFSSYCWIIALYFVSVLYGYFYSYPYFYEVFSTMFRPYLGHYWLSIMLAILILYGVCMLILDNMTKGGKHLVKVNPDTVWSGLAILFILILFLACNKIYQLGFTGKYIGHDYYDHALKMAGNISASLSKSNIIVFIEYVSPIIFILMIALLFSRKMKSTLAVYPLLSYLVLMMAFRIVVTTVTPFQYYYTRYLFAEIVPYTLLAVSLFLGVKHAQSKPRKVLTLLLSFSVMLYFACVTSFQFMGREGDGAAASLGRVARHFDERKLLIYDFESSEGFKEADSQILTPLVYYFSLNTLFVNSLQQLDSPMFKAVQTRYSDVFVLSRKPISSDQVQLIDVIGYKQGMFEGVSIIPAKYDYAKYNLYLYRVQVPVKNEI